MNLEWKDVSRKITDGEKWELVSEGKIKKNKNHQLNIWNVMLFYILNVERMTSALSAMSRRVERTNSKKKYILGMERSKRNTEKVRKPKQDHRLF